MPSYVLQAYFECDRVLIRAARDFSNRDDDTSVSLLRQLHSAPHNFRVLLRKQATTELMLC